MGTGQQSPRFRGACPFGGGRERDERTRPQSRYLVVGPVAQRTVKAVGGPLGITAELHLAEAQLGEGQSPAVPSLTEQRRRAAQHPFGLDQSVRLVRECLAEHPQALGGADQITDLFEECDGSSGRPLRLLDLPMGQKRPGQAS
jgi:hypothetical protein